MSSTPCAAASAQELPGPALEVLEHACARLGLYSVCGVLARDGDKLRNRSLLVGPNGLLASYDKSHLPFLGVDRFVVAGADELEPVETPIGRIGLLICYDLRFPEATRSLALRGADLIAHPTNWPVEARANAESITRTRARENLVYLLTANRVGVERTAEFCGWSQIVAPSGDRLVEADAVSEALLVADIDVEKARNKSLVPKSGEYEMHLFGHRRPELYGALVEAPAHVNQP
jgi:predicted amidohydrolase